MSTMRAIAEALFGEPTTVNGAELRFRRKGSLSVDLNKRVFFDHEAGVGGDVYDLVIHAGAADSFRSAQAWLAQQGCEAPQRSPAEQREAGAFVRTRESAAADLARRLWQESKPIGGTLAARYLESRALKPPYPPALHFHPACADGSFKRPALIAARTQLSAPRCVSSIQRTFLSKEGGKAELAAAKKALGACKGGGVVLGEIGDELVIAEGIETALSASAMFAMPAVATLGTSFTRGLIVPERVQRVIIAADNDEPGLRAAHALAARLRKEGRDVRVETPPPSFKDFNDLANGKERSVDALRSFRGGEPPHGR
ncbi:MAG: toprim domain-containing protein [Hyphomonadaceae bacterium]|nr:toprim domain-containing protein [Hyphomonadaceae bacterium]